MTTAHERSSVAVETRRFLQMLSSDESCANNGDLREEAVGLFRYYPLAAVKPDVSLSRWRIIETADGFKHLVGYDSLCKGCVASSLVSFDRQAMRAKARSGLVYQLVGKPGSFWDVEDVWELWFEANSAGICKEVTEQLLAQSADDDA
ncbi:BPSL0761 family protein [Paraburkholderia sp. HD33-4]|uniref:BPSL0761 family protein n=1 Tax=Paraburkholderia sp. HD33-4 TaxID=2883242 RepID=UPI001F40BDE6|nr:BPSL0761 family protein [Paraburkholderia sp. HD33-4]